MNRLTLLSILLLKYYMDMPSELIKVTGCTVGLDNRVQTLIVVSWLHPDVVGWLTHCRLIAVAPTISVGHIGYTPSGKSRYEVFIHHCAE